jgi:polyisoprenoid-binding protein YceI
VNELKTGKKIRRPWSGSARKLAFFALFILLATSVWANWEPPQQAASQAAAGRITLNLDPAQSKVHFTLGSTLHTVHGTFNMKSGALQFDPVSGSASGEFVAYATSGESGNDGRDKKMHDEILVSAKYPEVIFRPTKIEGTVTAKGTSSVQLRGIFVLCGVEHEIVVPVQADLDGSHWKGSAKFSVPYIQWGLKSPNTFLLKADPAVEIEADLRGPMQGPATP